MPSAFFSARNKYPVLVYILFRVPGSRGFYKRHKVKQLYLRLHNEYFNFIIKKMKRILYDF